MPKVTVILTSHNHAKYLRESIDSVLNQSFTDFALIIGDDASTDESWQIIQGYHDPRITAYRHETARQGVINELVASGQISSEYIAIQHSDDIWEPYKLEKQVAFLESHLEVGAVFTQVRIIDEDSNSLYDENNPPEMVFDQPNRSRHKWLNYFFKTGNALCHPSVLIRRSCYEECGLYRYGLGQLGDFDLWIRFCLKHEIHILPEKLFKLRVRANQMNASADRPDARIRRQFEILKILDNFRNITTFDELRLVFPEAEKFTEADDVDTGFILGMLSVEAETFYGNITRLFGLTLLFEALNDPNRAGRVAQLYNFNQQEFFKLSAKYDIFSMELASKFASQTSRLSVMITERNALAQALSEIHNSRAWKLITAYRDLQAKFISALSYRTK